LEDVDSNVVRLVPKNLFKYPAPQEDEISERARVVKDFCFPNGVLVKKLNYFYDKEKNQTEADEEVVE